MEWDDLRSIDRMHCLDALLTNPAYLWALKSIRAVHTNQAVYGADAGARENSRQHVLAVDEISRFFDEQYQIVKEAARNPDHGT
jgi:hypothetical protein